MKIIKYSDDHICVARSNGNVIVRTITHKSKINSLETWITRYMARKALTNKEQSK